MLDGRPPAPLDPAPATRHAEEHPGTLADDIAVGACAGLGGMTLVAVATMAALRAGLVGFSPLLLWYFRGGSLVLLGGGLIAAVLAETAFPRRLFALSSVLSLASYALHTSGVDTLPVQIGFAATMLGGAVVWVRRPAERPVHAIGEAVTTGPRGIEHVVQARDQERRWPHSLRSGCE